MNTGAPVPDSYYERIDEHRYKPTVHASGAWDPDELHFSPLGGLVVHAIERHLADRTTGKAADTGLVIGRISFDILGRLALDECEIQVETVRPGRTIELIEATVLVAGRAVVRARAWLLAALDTSFVAGGAPAPLTPPDEVAPWEMAALWPGGYIASIDVRPLSPPQPGRTTAWISTALDLVAGESASPLASYVGLVDTANGIAVRQPPTAWMYPNVDLTLHLYRQPEGPWTGLDTTVVFGGSGHGVTSTVLHDATGPVGYAHQMLTVRPQPTAQ
ncbi:thioesterase family protein [Streptomyces sp. NBC_01381]|uniref:thioesterase family protein n=1 Tax=Streptomyces sp. NBC_01381 TaxID=2903845 RepID=UPI002251C2A6|nr:thioesterase family protein [Streptomyces sp. NBC_01381]MCX4673115.1 thioesterase family protein [Streptomyces sp. NBC_01381]